MGGCLLWIVVVVYVCVFVFFGGGVLFGEGEGVGGGGWASYQTLGALRVVRRLVVGEKVGKLVQMERKEGECLREGVYLW